MGRETRGRSQSSRDKIGIWGPEKMMHILVMSTLMDADISLPQYQKCANVTELRWSWVEGGNRYMVMIHENVIDR